MSSEEIRRASVSELITRGYGIPEHIPPTEVRSVLSSKMVLARLACLHLCAAVAYGFSSEQALAWAEAEGVQDALDPRESRFLNKPSRSSCFQQQIEGMFTLTWALGLEDELDWFSAVDDQFAGRLPDLRIAEGLAPFKQRIAPRDQAQIARATDLGYCVHWLWREAALARGKPLPVEEYVIAERRRALEWLTGNGGWYEISLDT
ncbi:MAG: DUF4272 domain-containing protein [Sphingomonas sp.]